MGPRGRRKAMGKEEKEGAQRSPQRPLRPNRKPKALERKLQVPDHQGTIVIEDAVAAIVAIVVIVIVTATGAGAVLIRTAAVAVAAVATEMAAEAVVAEVGHHLPVTLPPAVKVEGPETGAVEDVRTVPRATPRRRVRPATMTLAGAGEDAEGNTIRCKTSQFPLCRKPAAFRGGRMNCTCVSSLPLSARITKQWSGLLKLSRSRLFRKAISPIPDRGSNSLIICSLKNSVL